jgi:predicted DNA-binding protein
MAKGQKKTVSILLPEELYQELSRQAEASSRSLSSYIRVVLTAHLEYLRRFRKL